MIQRYKSILTKRSFIGLCILSILILCFNQFLLLKLIAEITQMKHSSNVLSTMMTLFAISKIVILPISGFVSDKLGERTVIIFGGVFLTLFALYLLAQHSLIENLSVNYIIGGSIIGIISPPIYSLIPQIVDKTELPKANSLFQSINQVGQFLVPGIAGFLIVSMSSNSYLAILLLYTMMMLVTVVLFLPKGKQTNLSAVDMAVNKVESKYSTVFKRKDIVSLLIFTSIINLCVLGPQQVGLPLFVTSTLNRGADVYGLLVSVFGIGAFFGSVICGFIGMKFYSIKILMLVSIVFSLLWGTCTLITTLPILLGILLICGVLVGGINVIFLTLLQQRTPKELLGKTMSLQFLSSSGLQPISYLFTGYLIGRLSVESSFIILSICVLSVSIILFKRLRFD